MIAWMATALGIVLLGSLPAATAAAVRYEMARNRRVVPSTPRLVVWATVQWGSLALLLFALPQSLLPVYVGVIVGALAVSFLVLGLIGRRQEMVAVLNESLRVICRRGGSLADMAETFAGTDPSLLAGRARQFGDALRRGVPPMQAARRARLPLNSETMLALQHCGQAAWQQVGQESDENDPLREIPRANWPMASQVAYFLTVMLTIVLVGSFLVVFVMPTLQEMLEEYDGEAWWSRTRFDQQLQWILALLMIIGGVLLAATLLHLAYWLTAWRWITRLLPLTGPLLQADQRGNSLRGLAAAVEAGTEASQALATTSAARYRYGEAARLRRAAALVASGTPLGNALQKAGLVDRRQRPWIDAALATGRVAAALRSIADAAERHARIRFEALSTILFPLGVLGCGLLVLWIARLAFESLVELIYRVAAY